MATQLGFSEFNSNKTPINQRKNKTIKKKKNIPSKKVEEFLNSINYNNNDDDDDENDLADFNPNNNSSQNNKQFPPLPKLTSTPDEQTENNTLDNAVSPEAFNNLENEKMSSYKSSYVPYYNNTTNNNTMDSDLMKKLNYMIHLLEENKDEKTENITEELILYSFLGIFVIFVVDSFARAGKYTR